jgi:hypothetical protein
MSTGLRASAAYHSLTRREGLVSVALRNLETPYSVPKDYFAHAGRLARMLLEGDEHHEPVDRESFQRVVDWLDLNADGDYDEDGEDDPELEGSIDLWRQEKPGDPWVRVGDVKDLELDRVRAFLTAFSRYGLAI